MAKIQFILPTAEGCGHIHVKDLSGKQIGVFVKDELLEPYSETDTHLAVTLKGIIAESGTQDWDEIKTIIELSNIYYV